MSDTLTKIGLILIALVAGSAGAAAIGYLRGAKPGASRWLRLLTVAAQLMCLSLIALRWLWPAAAETANLAPNNAMPSSGGFGGGWQPIEVHADGLLLMAGMLAWCAGWLVRRERGVSLAGVLLFGVSGLCIWAACPANWRPFTTLEPVWHALHLVCVTLGTFAAALSAAGGGMYLLAARRLKRKKRAPGLEGTPGRERLSLESLEQLIVHGATAGFVLLTVSMIAGGVILSKEPGVMGAPYYASAKFWLAVLAWGGYGLLMNARLTPQLRGPYAAWVAIAGFVMLLVVYGVFTVVPDTPDEEAAPQTETAALIFSVDAPTVHGGQP